MKRYELSMQGTGEFTRLPPLVMGPLNRKISAAPLSLLTIKFFTFAGGQTSVSVLLNLRLWANTQDQTHKTEAKTKLLEPKTETTANSPRDRDQVLRPNIYASKHRIGTTALPVCKFHRLC